MTRGPLFHQSYHPQFSGHETFPLRYGWLKKIFDAINSNNGESPSKSIVFGDDAIARFGVGKNMVSSMRHWGLATKVIEEKRGSNLIHKTLLGEKLFGSNGLDPYIEHHSTLWLIHWNLSAYAGKTTWFWSFNHYPAITFDREQLVKKLSNFAKEQNWSRVAAATIKNDVACFVRTYAAQIGLRNASHDDSLESPLTELGLIKAVGKRDGFKFIRGPKATLGNGVFIYSLIDFWSRRFSNTSTLSFEAIAHEPGAPGRVFLMDENDVVDRLMLLDDLTKGAFRWSETAGLKQVVRNIDLDTNKALRFINKDYKI